MDACQTAAGFELARARCPVLVLITQATYALFHTTLGEALGYFQAAETTVQRLLKAEPEAAAPSAMSR
jgi:hypothetical protein